MQDKTTILLADDQVLFRESIGYIIEQNEQFEVVGMATNGEEAIDLCKRKRPNIVLMDIEMPVMDGVSATKKIKELFEDSIKIIVLTTFENPENILEAFVAKADGYIVKNITHEDLLLTIQCVARGLTVIHESVKHIMVKRFKGLTQYKSQYEELLSKKEVAIVKLIGAGKSNKEIASELNYSEGTIKNNITKILDKLKLADRIQIAIFAMENGIV